MSLRDLEKSVMGYLISRYKEGKLGVANVNFVVKSSDIPISVHNRVKGRVLKNIIAPKGFIKLLSNDNSNHVCVWKTCFNGGDMDLCLKE